MDVVLVEVNQFLGVVLSQLHVVHHLEGGVHKVHFEVQNTLFFLRKQNLEHFFLGFLLSGWRCVGVLVYLDVDLFFACIVFFYFVEPLYPTFPVFFILDD